MLSAHYQYLRYVLRHKWFVFWACFWEYRLIWRGLKHDWSKFMPVEWFPYVHYFYGDGGNRESKGQYNIDLAPLDFEMAWNHHQKANDHHWQYWVRFNDDGDIRCLPMPNKARQEMICDWIGAGKALGKNEVWNWYEANQHKMQLHPDTRAWVEKEMARIKNDARVANMLGITYP